VKSAGEGERRSTEALVLSDPMSGVERDIESSCHPSLRSAGKGAGGGWVGLEGKELSRTNADSITAPVET